MINDQIIIKKQLICIFKAFCKSISLFSVFLLIFFLLDSSNLICSGLVSLHVVPNIGDLVVSIDVILILLLITDISSSYVPRIVG